MNQRIRSLKEYIFNKKHHVLRQEPINDVEAMAVEFASKGLSPMARSARRFSWMMEHEKPAFLPGQRIAFVRTVPEMPAVFTLKEWDDIQKQHYVCELGRVFNLNGNYEELLRHGLGAKKTAAIDRLAGDCSSEAQKFLEASIMSVDAILSLCERYAAAAEAAGYGETAEMLRRVPNKGAETFFEALQLLRIMHFSLWSAGHYHNTLGRFDLYMYPYFKHDLEHGVSSEELFEQLEEFFILLNCDSDLYPGIQQGDNGQSMVLGGVDRQGVEVYNELTVMSLEASLELKLIDPKINLRVNKNTPIEVYELGTKLTREGLGFPQYTNDDIAIPGLLRWGYDLEDARDYVVAACWELIIPGKGMDINNIDALSFADAVREATLKKLDCCESFDDFKTEVAAEIGRRCSKYPEKHVNLFMEPAPVYSLILEGCIENARDASFGLKYNNFGIHGTGLANAADSLAAINELVYVKKSVSAAELTAALENNFEGSLHIRHKLLDAPKVGNNDDAADSMLCFLTDSFADGLEGQPNSRGGIYRAGTGSAMFYVLHGETLGATADGRPAGEWLSANYAPAIEVKTRGPFSVIHSFTKPDLMRVVNGGPLTLELHDSVFHSDDGISKTAGLIRLFILRDGHQLQVNTINRKTLIEAQQNPEKYRSLIVRVWGWSGYFVELDKSYQDHIIKRVEHVL